MSDPNKISYYDLRWELNCGRLPELIGRKDELQRISRVVLSTMHNNICIVGKAGIGKTALLYGWAAHHAKQTNHNLDEIILLNDESIANLKLLNPQALNGLPKSVIIIDNFSRLVYNQPQTAHNLAQWLEPILKKDSIKLIITLEPNALQWLREQEPGFLNHFEFIQLKTQPEKEQIAITASAYRKLKSSRQVNVDEELLNNIIQLTQRFPALGQQPSSNIKILDETMASALSERRMTATLQDLHQVISDRLGIPVNQLSANETDTLKNLESDLAQRIIGQAEPITTMVNFIQRAKLGLKNPNRPLASFLVLGPSGVGKTETAKSLAQLLFGSGSNFIRIDMSEFGESNTVPRLIGSPPGYVGYESGGELTNKVLTDPHALVLLDEIEKAHPKIFDIFLQLLDDGRLTSGRGELVDFTQTIVMATSNIGADLIVSADQNGNDIHDDQFFKTVLLPELKKQFRTEFINRFDAVIVFNPLSDNALLEIAILEAKKIEARAQKHGIVFEIDHELLKKAIQNIGDRSLGARPVKRYVENLCESLIAQAVLEGE